MNVPRKKDLCLIGALLMAALLLWAVLHLLKGPGQPAGRIIARVDGAIRGSWPLSENGAYDIDTPYGHNRIVVENGCAGMEEADCPDGYCMRQEVIRNQGDMIICLPHHLTVSAEAAGEEASGAEPEVDAVAGRAG